MKLYLPMLLIAVTASAGTLPKGTLACVNQATMQKLVQLKNAGNNGQYNSYATRMLGLGVCSRTTSPMNPDSYGRRDVGGGVTQMGSLFVDSNDIR